MNDRTVNGCPFAYSIPGMKHTPTAFPTDGVWARVLPEEGLLMKLMRCMPAFTPCLVSAVNIRRDSPAPLAPANHLSLPKALLAVPAGAHRRPDRSSSQTDCKPQATDPERGRSIGVVEPTMSASDGPRAGPRNEFNALLMPQK